MQKSECIKILIRDADMSDVYDVFEWRNDDLSRSAFVNSSVVTLSEHVDWYKCSLKDSLRRIFIGVVEGVKVGVVRFDLDSDSNISEVSINLNPLLRGRGYGFSLLACSIEFYKKNKGVILLARIKKGNEVSLRIFKKCQFVMSKEDNFFYYLTRN